MVKRLQRFMHNYAWHGVLQDQGIQQRAWMSEAIASAPRSDGGLQLPNLHDELLLLSATTLTRWLSATDTVADATGRTLASKTTVSTSLTRVALARGPTPAPKLYSSLATSGWSILRRAATRERTDEEREAVVHLLASAGRASLSAGEWIDGWYRRDFSRFSAPLKSLFSLQRQLHGRLNVTSLLASPVLGSSLLLHTSGRQLTAAHLPGLACSSATVGEILEMAWVAQVVQFRLRRNTYPAPRAGARHLIRELDRHDRQDLGVVTSLRHAERLARTATQRRTLSFAPHPQLSVTLPLWGSAAAFSKKNLRRLAADAPGRHAADELLLCGDAAFTQSPAFGAALDSDSWQAIHSLANDSCSTNQRSLPLGLGSPARTAGLSTLSDPRPQRRWHLPHSVGVPVSPTPVELPPLLVVQPRALVVSQPLHRPRLRQRRLQPPTASHAHEGVEHGLTLPALPRIHRRSGWPVPRTPSRLATTCVGNADHDCSVAHRQRRRDPRVVNASGCAPPRWQLSEDPGHARPSLLCRRACPSLLRTAHPRASSNLHDTKPKPTCGSTASHRAVDPHPLLRGGSQGNPDPGGSGACVVRVDAVTSAPTIVWSASMSYAHRANTNNQAEYQGLLAGLRAARRHQWPALEVIGDSNLIINQLRRYRAPKNPRLLLHHTEARRLADQSGVTAWTHQVRAHNKMADSLANLAVDSATSSQTLHPTTRSGHVDIHAYLSNDFRPWLTVYSSPQVI